MACQAPAPTEAYPGELPKETEAKDTSSKNQVAAEEEGSEKPSPLTNATVKSFYRQYAAKHSGDLIQVSTDFGNIKIKLYNNAPLHRANMLYLTQEGYFNGTWFHRVSKGHVIQAGNNDERQTAQERMKFGDFTIPAEALSENYHKRGAVAAARSYNNNPRKRSDPYEFYIVLGSTFSEGQLAAMEKKNNVTFNNKQRQIYTTIGGAPHLDGQHTVFGEVVEGMDVVEAISQVQVDSGEWPLKNIPIKVHIP